MLFGADHSLLQHYFRNENHVLKLVAHSVQDRSQVLVDDHDLPQNFVFAARNTKPRFNTPTPNAFPSRPIYRTTIRTSRSPRSTTLDAWRYWTAPGPSARRSSWLTRAWSAALWKPSVSTFSSRVLHYRKSSIPWPGIFVLAETLPRTLFSSYGRRRSRRRRNRGRRPKRFFKQRAHTSGGNSSVYERVIYFGTKGQATTLHF